MTISDTLMIVAVIAGPILAVQVQKWIERTKERKYRKERIFKILMATRGNVLSQQRVEDLNMIDLEFNNKKEEKVLNEWKLYFDHLNNRIRKEDPDFKVKNELWGNKSEELQINLLYAMSQSLNYRFDRVQLKNGIYIPQGHVDLEEENKDIRESLKDIISGKKSFPIEITGIKLPLKNQNIQENQFKEEIERK